MYIGEDKIYSSLDKKVELLRFTKMEEISNALKSFNLISKIFVVYPLILQALRKLPHAAMIAHAE